MMLKTWNHTAMTVFYLEFLDSLSDEDYAIYTYEKQMDVCMTPLPCWAKKSFNW
jgi:hypothetical protein